MHQYFTPPGEQFVGDCMPFWQDDVFHLYWLLDEEHHRARGGLGGHQWAHSTTRDLVHWEDHPLALAIEREDEGSICTGSILHHEGIFYAFYAVRRPDWSQHLCVATSPDGIHFTKSPDNPIFSPPADYAPQHFRDPVCFRDPGTGLFHVLVTAEWRAYPLAGRGGCLAHLVSADLRQWQLTTPFLIPGFTDVPECPDYFYWNEWYYLLFSNNGVARYRMSRQPLGPWVRPSVDMLDNPLARVMKTVAFGPDRRIGVAWLAWLQDGHDFGPAVFGGNAIFREIVQKEDGTLSTCLPAEMTPAVAEPLALRWQPLTTGIAERGEGWRLLAAEGLVVVAAEGVPPDYRLVAKLTPQGPTGAYGLGLRGSGAYAGGYELRLSPPLRQVDLRPVASAAMHHDANRTLAAVEGLDGPVTLEVICRGDIIDVCVNGRRTLISRCLQPPGDRLFLFCHNGAIVCEDVVVQPLTGSAGG